VFGPASADVVRRALPDVARVDLEGLRVLDNHATAWHGEPVTIVRRDDLGGLGFDLWIAASSAGDLSRALVGAGAVTVDAEVVEACRVEAGRPVFGRDMTEDTIPLEAGIEDRAISQTKGCYVGQEVIIRVLHRGHGRVARRLVGLTCDPRSDVPAAGSPIASRDRAIGSVTSAVWSPSLERPIALGYVHRDFVEPGTAVTIGSGTAAVVTSLPFV
jgi:folate-binding protein YgfZ